MITDPANDLAEQPVEDDQFELLARWGDANKGWSAATPRHEFEQSRIWPSVAPARVFTFSTPD